MFRSDLWPEDTTAALINFLDRMFVEEGAPHGFLQIARSFFKAGFFEDSAECARLGAAAGGRQAQARSSRARELRETISELDRLAARADAERRALQDQDG